MEGPLSFRLVVAAIAFTFLNEAICVYSCPPVCLCYVDEGGLRTANCSGVKFLSENKYNKAFYEIEVLNLRMGSDDEPIKLWDEMFISFSKLKVLNLDNCKINYLPKNVFKGLKKIFEINLASNDIRHFDHVVFENIYNLNKLILRGNQLQGSNKPLISSSSLRELDIGYCGIAVLQNEFFHGVKKLARLYLDGNHLQTVKDHILPRGIIYLNLANNRIVNVPISTINSLSQLRWLDLGANPINCTCSLMNLQDILSGHAIIMDGDLRCAYPPELENMKLSKVNENEICNKETFSPRYHFKKSQTSKYTTYQKKEYYFENEKYNPFELQGDDPGTSADDYTDDESQKGTNKSSIASDKTDKEVKVHDIHKTEPENLVENNPNTTDNKIKEHETPKIVVHESNESEEQSLTVTDGTHQKTVGDSEEHSSQAGIQEPNNKNQVDIKSNISVENTTVHSANGVQEIDDDTKNNDDIDPTHLPLSGGIDDMVDGELPESLFDDNMKDDEVMPILLHHDFTTEKLETNATTEKHLISMLGNNDSSKIDEEIEKDQQSTMTNETTAKLVTAEPVINCDDCDDIVQQKKLQNALSGVIDPNEDEGSGDGIADNTTNTSSAPVFLPGIYDITEETIHKTETQPVETQNKIHEENEHLGQIVDKKPINYEEMGPHIVVGCIIVFIVILIFVSVYKGFCKSKEANRKPLNDVESNPGTELQDITSSLLPKTQLNDDKHNNKYPNEIPSTETVNLIKVDKAEEQNGIPDSHDHNQNDSKNERIIKNGKPRESSPPPIEKTKAKLTVLLESIPRTPIFVQKRPTTLNNV